MFWGHLPAERDRPWSVTPLLDQGLVELSSGAGMYDGPAVVAVVLEAGHVGAKERGKLAATAHTLALVAHLIIKDVRFHLHLKQEMWLRC